MGPARYEITEALMRVERAAREYVETSGPRATVRYNLLRSELRNLDDVRAKWAARERVTP